MASARRPWIVERKVGPHWFEISCHRYEGDAAAEIAQLRARGTTDPLRVRRAA